MRINTHSNLRPETLEVIKKLEAEKMEVHILSGDASGSVRTLGNNLNIPEHCLHS